MTMKKSLVIGRKIVEVRQHRTTDQSGLPVWDVTSIVLDNGTVLIPQTVELGHDYATEIHVYPQKNKED